MSTRRDILFVSTADWDNPFWTNKQHVAVELSKSGNRILYVESLGLRQPTLAGRDIGRIWRRLNRGVKPPRHVRDNIWVWSPLVLPFHGIPIVRSINKLLTTIGWKFAARLTGLRPKMIWTYSPLTTEQFDLSEFDLTIYHAVDDIKAQPGMPREVIANGEDKLAKSANVVFCTAPAILTRLERLNSETHYLPNVADFDHFNRAMAVSTVIPADLEEIPGPRIGFIGAVSAYKMDLSLIREVADRHPEWSFVLIGEVGEGEPGTDINIILNRPNIRIFGPRPYNLLPDYLKGIDVAIIPSSINEYTSSMFPMKFFEYLAAGRPVVSTALPALADFAHVAHFTRSVDEFELAIGLAISGKVADLEARLAAAREQTYAIRTKRMLDHVERVAKVAVDPGRADLH